ncbi:MAG TPA: hypothetical protein P5191_16030 [Ruminococcus sp.]|nr:hypothetical protein [Ruminococcus sp.]
MRKSKANTIQGGVLAENQAKIDSYEKSIKAALERKRKIIVESKLYTYDTLSELYGGAEGQVLLDAVTAEHTLIGKLTDSGMSYADIEGLVNSSDGADSKSGDDADSDSADDEFVGQTSFFGDNSYKD